MTGLDSEEKKKVNRFRHWVDKEKERMSYFKIIIVINILRRCPEKTFFFIWR